MGVSYNIIPTSELSLDIEENRNAFLNHFKSIDSYCYPKDWHIKLNSKYPTLIEIYKCFETGQIVYNLLNEELKENKRTQLCFEIAHKLNKYQSDFTVEHLDNQLKSMRGIKGDFNMLLRMAAEITKLCGSMIIFSPYESYYIEEGKKYDELWNQIKDKWAGEE